jgi:hypothetical protein
MIGGVPAATEKGKVRKSATVSERNILDLGD